MTPAEVLNEVQKMPVAEKRHVLRELTEQLEESTLNGYSEKERRFLDSMKRKGLITKLPLRKPDNARRLKFKPVKVEGEPVSETIIRERR